MQINLIIVSENEVVNANMFFFICFNLFYLLLLRQRSHNKMRECDYSPFPTVAEAVQEELESYRAQDAEVKRLKTAMVNTLQYIINSVIKYINK